MNVTLRPAPSPREQFEAGRQAMLRGLRALLRAGATVEAEAEVEGTKQAMRDLLALEGGRT